MKIYLLPRIVYVKADAINATAPLTAKAGPNSRKLSGAHNDHAALIRELIPRINSTPRSGFAANKEIINEEKVLHREPARLFTAIVSCKARGK